MGGRWKNEQKIYRKVARKNGVSVKQVREGIQEAINAVYINPNEEAQKILRQGSVPTSDEMIDYMAGKVKRKFGM